MKKLLLIAATAIALVAATSCDHTDYDSYYSDISIEDIVSLWHIEGEYSWGTELSDNCVREGSDWRKPPIRSTYFVLFNENGTGIVYTVNDTNRYTFVDEIIPPRLDSARFTYKTDDACHFDIMSAQGEQRKITFAKENYWGAGKRETRCIVYSIENTGGRDIYRWHRCNEIRCDSSINYDELKGRISVPKKRVWQGKSLNGFYNNCNYWNTEEFENFEFHSNGAFIANKGNHEQSYRPERRGTYKIYEGVNDSIVFRFDDGRKDEYQVIFDRTEAYLYMEGKQFLHLLALNQDCEY